jgi:hypothetical protein
MSKKGKTITISVSTSEGEKDFECSIDMKVGDAAERIRELFFLDGGKIFINDTYLDETTTIKLSIEGMKLKLSNVICTFQWETSSK